MNVPIPLKACGKLWKKYERYNVLYLNQIALSPLLPLKMSILLKADTSTNKNFSNFSGNESAPKLLIYLPLTMWS